MRKNLSSVTETLHATVNRFLAVLHTVRYLKLGQIVYRIYYRFRRPRVGPVLDLVVRRWRKDLPVRCFIEPATDDGRRFRFLGQSTEFSGNWNDKRLPKLWLYNLHYQDDLNAKGSEARPELCRELIDAWIAGNPPMQGNGWEPYCLSLRIVNWVKCFSRLDSGQIDQSWLHSLATQASALSQQLEYHILGNHLFANAKALVFVGAFFGDKQGDLYLKQGLRVLDKQVREQFLDDGGHFELSPMYHASLLWDLADLVALQQAGGLPELSKRVDSWVSHLNKGLEWLETMVHPDGDISFFNDAAFGIAPTLSELKAYSGQLGIPVPENSCPQALQSHWLSASGYAVIDWPGGHRLIADVARVGPDYQPGHAHADTLSCELSLFGQRFLVNSGISQYGEGSERHRQRSTAAHNTVEVEGQNSSEVWAGFRVARRARPFDIEVQDKPGVVYLAASHNGYKRLPGRVTHRRYWRANVHGLEIEDELFGSFERSVAHWHFHPDVSVHPLGQSCFEAHLPDSRAITLEILGAEGRLVESSWHPRFGTALDNQTLELEFSGEKLTTRIQWSSV